MVARHIVVLLVLCPVLSLAALRGTVIEDFEGSAPELASYPGQDQDPADWQLSTSSPFGGSGHSLRLFGEVVIMLLATALLANLLVLPALIAFVEGRAWRTGAPRPTVKGS